MGLTDEPSVAAHHVGARSPNQRLTQLVIATPSSASLIAGAQSSAQGRVPHRFHIVS